MEGAVVRLAVRAGIIVIRIAAVKAATRVFKSDR